MVIKFDKLANITINGFLKLFVTIVTLYININDNLKI